MSIWCSKKSILDGAHSDPVPRTPHIAFDNDNAIKPGTPLERLSCMSLLRWMTPMEPVWVMIKYERPQNYCYDCGRIGHEARNCKYPAASKDEDDIEGRAGNGLGTPHVELRKRCWLFMTKGGMRGRWCK
ncbi:hypothetical protein K1719_041389 [Acacia pycnantha]|nr:hypothetical protein K1719_041389 [Acacia pycnantha]